MYLIANNVVGAVLGFIFWIIAARFYTAEQLTVISAIGLLALFSAVGLGEGIVRFVPGSGKNTAQLINTAMTITLITSLIAGIIFLVGLETWFLKLLFIKDNPAYLISFILLTMIFPLAALMDAWYLAGRRDDFVFYRGTTFNVLTASHKLLYLFQRLYLFIIHNKLHVPNHKRLRISRGSSCIRQDFGYAWLISYGIM